MGWDGWTDRQTDRGAWMAGYRNERTQNISCIELIIDDAFQCVLRQKRGKLR